MFVDATSSLDRFNSSAFVVSTSTPTSSIMLGVIVTYDEQQSTIYRGLELLPEVLPQGAFSGKGQKRGPSIIMTDDRVTEHGALQSSA